LLLALELSTELRHWQLLC